MEQQVLVSLAFDAFNDGAPRIWTSSLIIPAYVAAASLVILVLHLAVERVYRRVRGITPALPESSSTSTGIFSDVKYHIETHGGPTIFSFKFSRFLGCLVMLGLSIATFILDEPEIFVTITSKWGKKHTKHGKEWQRLSEMEWLHFTLVLTFAYASLLSIFSLTLGSLGSKRVSRHLATVLLVVMAVYAYRDVWPLMTFTLQPLDLDEGWLLWVKFGIVTVIAFFLPMMTPSQYVPFDPLDPQEKATPEQTTSLMSLVLWTWLDPLIYKAWRAKKFDPAELPPIADSDMTKNLRQVGFKEVDRFSGSPKGRGLFWGIMKIYRKEFSLLTVFVVFQVLFEIASPVGVNKLLRYLETKGEGAVVRPWVWLLWLFFAPLLSTASWQMYIYFSTRTLVRTEGLITQLVFEHALRMRASARSPDSNRIDSTPATPSTPASVGEADTESHLDSDGSGDETLASSTTVKVKESSEPLKKEQVTEDNLTGKINNLVSSDLDSIVEGRDLLLVLVKVPLAVGLSIFFLYQILGWSAFVGLASIVLLFPIPGYFASLIHGAQTVRMKKTDSRVQSVTETMNVIRMIKLFGWEKKMQERVANKRDDELIAARWRQILDMTSNTMTFIIPIITMMSTYMTFTLIMKKDLSASIVFSSMTVFENLRGQMGMMFWQLPTFIEAKVSLDRVESFLLDTELLDEFREKTENDEVVEQIVGEGPATALGFRDASFTWSEDQTASAANTPSRRTFVLQVESEVLFHVGEFNMVIGPTSSGKTALLMALLGEMHFIRSSPSSWFNLPRDGGVAYCAQESWVMNETIRENIIFGEPFNQIRYDKVIYQCGLTRDLELFEAGDQTEVGEKGLTLSGGQKARVTLARAIYSKAKILLLDDVLAALDVHTAKWIVDECFSGDLVKNTGRTVILVTHNVALVSPLAQFVVAVGSAGKVTQGPLAEILTSNPALLAEVAEDTAAIEKAGEEIDIAAPDAKPTKADGKLVAAEEVEEGHVGWPALKLFLHSLAGQYGLLFWIGFLGFFALANFTETLSVWFLGYFSSQYDNHHGTEVNVAKYLAGYSILLGIVVFFNVLGRLVWLFGALRAMRRIHALLVESVLSTTLRWLDSTPVSRVIARCTQDIRAVDGQLPEFFEMLCNLTIEMLARLAGVLFFTPWAIIPAGIISALGGLFGQIYIKVQLIVKREMSNARAPVLAVIQASSTGLVSIRAYGAQQRFRETCMTKIDKYTRNARLFYNLNRWICVRIDALGAGFSAGLALYLVYFKNTSAADTGFSLNMSIAFSSMILWWVRILNMFEVAGNSLERINGYLNIDHEPKPTPKGVPPAYWPASGCLTVEGLTARYSLDGPAVLHGISFSVLSGERIGVVGRTGSGKSSLTLALLRAIPTTGLVSYDGQETSALNLDALRENVTIIPQVPELLSGTLRQNLDPFGQHDDATLNDALRAAGLMSLQEDVSLDDRVTLDTMVSSGGANLSIGERQIFALARAIVRQSKILILDEATSAIDYKTDTIIQNSLRKGLGNDITVITVAHRLQTIMDADKIMVLDAGNIAEFDTPKNLLLRDNGLLKALVDESGDKETLQKMASKHSSQQ